MLLRLAAAALLALVVSPPAAEGRLRLTHRVTVSGALTDEWTVNAQEACSPVGSGKLTLDFKTSPSRGGLVRPGKRGRGRWVLEIPAPGSFVKDMRALPATGSSTRTDDTQPQPSPPPDVCDPLEKTGCGTQALRNLKVHITGVDQRRLGQLDIGPFFQSHDCFRGYLDGWRHRGLVGRELFFPMPSQATLARQRVTVIHASSRKRFVSANLTETVVRRATVTLTRR